MYDKLKMTLGHKQETIIVIAFNKYMALFPLI